ncbi:hypothetical protein V9T40_001731 [Parthenolecanium corni]|uniref:Uncharacterized protein n=1 Tax=Parthenolecanium corni TaxID=536013 RepID=A0AAN9Y4W6_9HEMI
MMSSATGSDEIPAFDVLARKTVEILDVVSSTRQLLIEQYNNDQTMWLDAMFRILMWKNQAFLLEERNSSVRDTNVHKILRDLMLEMFRVTDEQSLPAFGSIQRNHLLEAGCNLISTFRVFVSFLLQTKLDVGDEIANLQYIAKNIEKYLERNGGKSEEVKSAEQEKTNSAEQEKVKSAASEPEKATSLVNEPQKEKSVANEPSKMKLATTELKKVGPATNESQKVKSAASESQKVKPIGNELEKIRLANIEIQKMKNSTSKRNLNEETFGSEAIELALKDSVVVGEKRSITPAKVGANDRLCEVCNEPVVVFNNDEEFSLSLHARDPKHKKAVKKKVNATKVAPEEGNRCSLDEDIAIRSDIIDLVGPVHARFFRIDAFDEFFCTACKCSVYSTHNVVTHVQGRNHKKNSGFQSQESKESRSGSDSRDLTSDEVDSAEDDTVFRVGSTIPVKSLF